VCFLQRSKDHFLHTSSERTGAIINESSDSGAVERKKLIMELSKPRGKACLSLGCGLGRFLRDYSKYGAKIVVGLDINRSNLEKCKEIEADLVLGDIENLPFNDNAFDVFDCMATMEHIARPIKAMKENRRVLKQNTGLSFATWHCYRWILALTSPSVRRRFLRYIHDVIADTVPRIGENKLLKSFFADYGTMRNKGFSYPEIQEIYNEANLKIVLLKIYHHVIFIASKVTKRVNR
jgi:ubiquinone/menaquinone biosynthesis C-methylase UbiE